MDPSDALESRASALVNALREGTFYDGETTPAAKESPDAGLDASGSDGDAEGSESGSDAEVAEAADDKAKAKDAPKDERREALDRAMKLERANVQKAAKLDQREAHVTEQETNLKGRAQELEQREKAIAAKERVFQDEALWLDHLVKNIPLEKALSVFQKAANDPSYHAELAARKVLAEAAPKKDDEETATLKKQIEELRAEREREKTAAAVANAERTVIAKAEAHADKAPLAARLAKAKPDKFLKRAHAAADELRKEGAPATYESVLDKIQEQLQAEKDEAEQLYGFSSKPEVENSTSPKSNPTGPGKQPRTLTARTSAGRSTVPDDDDDFASLPVDDRAARIKELARKRAE
jgi:hypothetical protein